MVPRYYVDIAGKNVIKMAKCIKYQLAEDKAGGQMTPIKQNSPLPGGREPNFAAGRPELRDLARCWKRALYPA